MPDVAYPPVGYGHDADANSSLYIVGAGRRLTALPVGGSKAPVVDRCCDHYEHEDRYIGDDETPPSELSMLTELGADLAARQPDDQQNQEGPTERSFRGTATQPDALNTPQLEADSNGHQHPAHNYEGKLDQQHDLKSATRGRSKNRVH